MPRGRGGAAKSAAATARRVAADQAAAAAAAAAHAAADAAEEETAGPSCAICLDPLSMKRELTLQPCGHVFHRTCLIDWTETRTSMADQLCPMDRKNIVEVINHHGLNAALYVDCLGLTGKPTKNQVIENARSAAKENAPFPMKDFLTTQLAKIPETIKKIADDRKLAVKEKKPADYVDDCKAEEKKLDERLKIYKEMNQIYQEGGMRRPDNSSKWNYNEELVKVKQEKLQRELNLHSKLQNDLALAASRIDILRMEIQSIEDAERAAAEKAAAAAALAAAAAAALAAAAAAPAADAEPTPGPSNPRGGRRRGAAAAAPAATSPPAAKRGRGGGRKSN